MTVSDPRRRPPENLELPFERLTRAKRPGCALKPGRREAVLLAREEPGHLAVHDEVPTIGTRHVDMEGAVEDDAAGRRRRSLRGTRRKVVDCRVPRWVRENDRLWAELQRNEHARAPGIVRGGELAVAVDDRADRPTATVERH